MDCVQDIERSMEKKQGTDGSLSLMLQVSPPVCPGRGKISIPSTAGGKRRTYSSPLSLTLVSQGMCTEEIAESQAIACH